MPRSVGPRRTNLQNTVETVNLTNHAKPDGPGGEDRFRRRVENAAGFHQFREGLPRLALGGGEEQVAIPEALQRVEQRVVGLVFPSICSASRKKRWAGSGRT